MQQQPQQPQPALAAQVSAARFSYGPTSPPVCFDVNLSLPRGARMVLVGSNGAGKSTLMNLIGGRRKPSGGTVRALGEDAFESTALALRINMVTTDWQIHLNLPVRQLVTSAAEGVPRARLERLIEALDAEELLEREIASLSDGQRRRVQLLCKLLPPRELILLDEVTNSLDILARAKLLEFLRTEESEARGASVVFCTHIFDGLDGWATDVAHMDAGRVVRHVPASQLPAGQSLYQLVRGWLLETAAARRRAASGGGAAPGGVLGARASAVLDEMMRELDARGRPAHDPSREDAASASDLSGSQPKKQRADQGPAPVRAASPSGAGSRSSVSSAAAGVGAGAQPGDARAQPQGEASQAHAAIPAGPAATSSSGAGGPPPPREAPRAPPPPHPPQPQAAAADAPTGGAAGARPPGGALGGRGAGPPPAPPRARLDRQLPADAERMAPTIQSALGALEEHVRMVAHAVADGDLGALGQARQRVSDLWAQAQLALTSFEKVAAAGKPGDGGAPNPAGGGASPAAGGPAAGQPSSQQLPLGWGERHNMRAEDELLSRGAIAPLPPGSQLSSLGAGSE